MQKAVGPPSRKPLRLKLRAAAENDRCAAAPPAAPK